MEASAAAAMTGLFTPARRAAAWGVHLYTALGLVCALMTLLAAEDHDPHGAFAWLVAALVIDSTDGMLARKVGVKQVLPFFDGRKLDDITDFANYVLVPIFLLWKFGLVPPGTAWVLALPLLASGYGFCNEGAKTSDGYFTGFPSYWNVVFIYAYLLRVPSPWLAVVLVVLSALVFVPIKYLYPTHSKPLMALTIVFNVIWIALLIPIVMDPDHANVRLVWGSLLYPAYYFAVSLALHVRDARQAVP